MPKYDYDLFVIGAGSGGVRAARIAAAHGAKVAIAEEYRIGGTCVIRGCVPKKLLVYGSHFAEDLDDAKRYGWKIENATFDWPTLRDNVLAEVARLSGLYTETLTNHKVEMFDQRAVLTGPHGIELGDRAITADKILIATGARPRTTDRPGCEHGITSNEVFHLEKLPRRIVIEGGGYIANEFAGIFNKLGSKVTLINRSDAILRGYDEQIRDRLLQISMSKGIRFLLNSPIDKVEKHTSGSLTVHMQGGDDVECDALLFATGRAPNTKDLGLERAGVEIDEHGVQLTPVAIREGQAFADTFFGDKPTKVDYNCIPSAVFSHPPLAGVGLTESQARSKLGVVKVYTSDFRPMKNVLAGRNERSLYKLVVDEASQKVVGAHMIGPDAPEILQMVAVAVKAGLTKTQFDACVAIHPTMAEELVLLR
jgi:glutathione reductase (NADPH)